MSFKEFIIFDPEGRRSLTADKLPLRIGTGNDCALRLPGPGSAAVAVLDQLDGAPFLQPIGQPGVLTVNGEPLLASRRLHDGDVAAFFGSRIEYSAQDDIATIRVFLEDSAYLTLPPESGEADDGKDDEAIAPAAFRRAGEIAARQPATTGHRWQAVIGLSLSFLVLVSYLLFSATSVRFDIEPEFIDEFNIDGGWFHLPFGDRYLLRKGTYTAKVSKQGYYDISQAFTVADEPSLTVPLYLRKLPGELIVTTDPASDAVVTVDSKYIERVPYGPLELEPGVHTVSLESERFLPFFGELHMPGLGIEQHLEVQLVPRWADVEIITEPAGADIYAGETRLGQTPAVVELFEGMHDVSVILDGYRPWDGQVRAIANIAQSLPVIKLELADAELLVNTIPRRANVTVNGKYRGQSPLRVALAPGITYQVGVSKAGYGSTTRQVRLGSAAKESVSIDLTAVTGTLNLQVAPASATVFVDGQSRGAGSMTLNLTSAPHELEVRREGYQSFKKVVTPRPGFPQSINIRLRSDEELRLAATDTSVKTAKGQSLRRVEPGTLVLGASRSEPGRRANEVLVPATLTQPFYIGVNEVTNKDFMEFRKAHDSGSSINPSMTGDRNPVVNVSWQDAVEYCNWLSAQEGLTPVYESKFDSWVLIRPMPNGYRLPTEAEWEWAIRYAGGAKPMKYSWGPKMPPKKDSGNFADQAAKDLVPSVLPGYDDGYAATAPVGTFTGNALGIFDGAGNAAEWVQDYYSVPTPGQTKAVIDPLGPTESQHYVIRGSSWRHSGISELRLSYRDFGSAARPDVGFRIARNAQ